MPLMSTGCDCWSCEEIVCYFDPYCCQVEWDYICDGEAGDLCTCCRGNYPGYCLPEEDGGADVPATDSIGGVLLLLAMLGAGVHFMRRRSPN